jgi:signal transduction histidine kinase
LDQKVESSGSLAIGAALPEAGPETTRGRLRLLGFALPRFGLSSKLLLLTLLFVMLAEVLIFFPSVANFRINWLSDRLTAAQLAALAAEASPTGDVPQALRNDLLRTAQVKAVAVKRDGQRHLILADEMPHAIDRTYDLTMLRQGAGISDRLTMFWDALAIFFSADSSTVRVLGRPVGDSATPSGDVIEIVLKEAPLKTAMLRFGLNVLGLSIIISVITAALVYLALNLLLVRPMMRIAENMLRFSGNPEDKSRIIVPSARRDELGTAERELAHMQTELSQLLNQKNRLAALGLAVSKINHDLRNLLANAQLLSDRLTTSPDPTVQSFAPKLIASLDRAIAFCNDTLRFGRAAERPPRRESIALIGVVEEVGEGLGLPREGVIGWRISISPDLRVDADHEHLFRVLTNLVRNAVQAIEALGATVKGEVAVEAVRDGAVAIIRVSDDGPGVPPKAREFLFQAFQGSARRGGTGLGLAIAQELMVAHGGRITLLETDRGAVFEVRIPDRAKS